ncbi:MAG: glycosyltransferase [Dehalococcoidia bacterium]
MSERPLKIVQAVGPTRAGGLERVVEALSVGLHRRGHHVTVATALLTTDVDHPFVKALTLASVPIHEIRIQSREYLKERRRFEELCRRLKPDVVHTHGYRRDIVYRPAAASLGIPTVTTIHGRNRSGGLKGRLFEWLQTRNFRRFDAVVAVSKALFDETVASGVGTERVHLIPNAFGSLRPLLARHTARECFNVQPDAQVVGWVGRLTPVKGPDIFLDALSRMPIPRPSAVLVGYGPEEVALRRQANELGLASNVVFQTQVHDAGRYFRAFDVFVLSTRSEGLPIVLLEAMDAEVPIVATRVGGIPDVLGTNEAWLVPAQDPAALASAIDAALTNRALALDRTKAAARRLKGEHGLDTFLDRYEAAYRSVISRKEYG